jgi:hypothetical protein
VADGQKSKARRGAGQAPRGVEYHPPQNPNPMPAVGAASEQLRDVDRSGPPGAEAPRATPPLDALDSCLETVALAFLDTCQGLVARAAELRPRGVRPGWPLRWATLCEREARRRAGRRAAARTAVYAWFEREDAPAEGGPEDA